MKQEYSNRLSGETSPYLLQHAQNPVNWYPWGEEALKKAQEENKILLVSIGYAACHWCHVMERESFENKEIAGIMNAFFVCVKVDREERPDIDQIYMDAVQLMTGGGGWPLNCFALPNGKPFYGGTYYSPDDWTKVLQGIQNAWDNEPEKVKSVADQLADGIRENERIAVKKEDSDFVLDDLKQGFKRWKTKFDTQQGSNKGAPKFPLPNSLQFLLHYYYYSNNKEALTQVLLTLDKMARGGIYDQAGGGFARYSVDEIWKVPHFEKMLYDNAQLISLYAEAYRLTKSPLYRRVMKETIAFAERELSLPGGGFYSSLDADSEGVEGKFYVWEKQEIVDLLGKDAELFCSCYGIQEKANWEEGNILMLVADRMQLAKQYGISEKKVDETIERGKALLLQQREKRIRPALDDKLLCSWNALMVKAYTDAYKALGTEAYLQRATECAVFIHKQFCKKEGGLHRSFKNGASKINGFLDDYSCTIEAFIALYQVGFDEQWLQKAENLMQHVLQHFTDEKSGMFFYTSDEDPALIARKMDLTDNVIPSSNSSMAKNLFLLGSFLGRNEYHTRAKQMLANVKARLQKSLAYHSNWAQTFFWLVNPPYELVVAGKDAIAKKKGIEALFLPDVLISGSLSESKLPLLKNRFIPNETHFYLCKDQACKLPVASVEEVLELLHQQNSTPYRRSKSS